MTELKHACDDAVKFVSDCSVYSFNFVKMDAKRNAQYYGRPAAYTQSHKNEDVRLVLGWSSSIIALGSAYYGYIHDFQATKTIVTVGVIA